MRSGFLVKLAVAALILAAGAEPTRAASPLSDPIPGPIPFGDITISLEIVATGFTSPLWGTHAGDGSRRLFVADQIGKIYEVDLDTKSKRLLLDVSGRLVSPFVFFEERGSVGLALHPDYPRNGLLYTFTGEPARAPADFTVALPVGTFPDHQSVITQWRVRKPTDRRSVVDPASARVLLRIDQPQSIHNGGCLVFGPDRMLYISLGDGGNLEDEGPGHGTIGNGQDTSTALGSILRIDVDGRDSANGRYGIPPDNPFVGRPGLDEIFAYGFRNPFRMSFDSATGDFYLADVGQYSIEEIDLIVAGGNYGWNLKEGSFFFMGNGPSRGFVTDMDPGVPAGLIDPIAEFDHDEGIAVIGGFVYRGSAIPELVGRYVFADVLGRLFYLDEMNQIRELRISYPSAIGIAVLGFGQDTDGEIYVMGNPTSRPVGTDGVVLKILPSDTDGDGVLDPLDNCRFTVNPGQEDAGGVGPNSGRDGIGTDCQCGDTNEDGFVTKEDGELIKQSLRKGAGSRLSRPDECDVDGNGVCTKNDASVIEHALHVPPKATIVQRCAPALP